MFIAEESKTNRKEIRKIESLLGKDLPSEYINFLLTYNGASCYPNRPSVKTTNLETKSDTLFPIDRFLSVGDIINYKSNNCWFDFIDHIPDDVLVNLNLDKSNLLIFALGERGNYLLNLADDDYSRIYFSCYSGCDGLSKLMTNSFNEFINSLSIESDLPKEEIKNLEDYRLTIRGHKCFHPYYFYHGDNHNEIYANRFYECYNFKHSQIINYNTDGRTFLELYIDHLEIVKYLISRGHKPAGLKYAKKYNVIEFLISQDLNLYKLDEHKGFSYDAPIIRYSKSTNYYHVFHQFLVNKNDIDWDFEGLDGLTVIENLNEMVKRYFNENEAKRKQYIQSNQEHLFKPYLKSNLITKLLGLYDN
jgi:hypothetical protein